MLFESVFLIQDSFGLVVKVALNFKAELPFFRDMKSNISKIRKNPGHFEIVTAQFLMVVESKFKNFLAQLFILYKFANDLKILGQGS